MRFCQLAPFFCAVVFISGAYAEESVAPSGAHVVGSAKPASGAAAATQPAKAHAGFIDEKYENGKPKSHYAIDAKGVKWGPYTLYSEDGKRVERGTFRSGELEGTRQTFYPNGTIKLQENYRKGQISGAVIENDEKGAPVRSAEFNAGIPVNDRTMVDGVMVYPRSREMIVAELNRIHKSKIETVPATAAIPPHDGGNDSEADREDGVRRLMEYRYLCYVPYEGMKLDPVYCAHDEAAVGILAVIGKLDHTPPNPGWPEDRYKYAYTGTSNSNLHQNSGGGPLCVFAVNGFMDDSDASNIDRVGHRRWCLNPPMAKVGFASFKGFAAMWSMDASRKEVSNFDFVAYPAPGFFPNSYFGSNTAWSISLNETQYRKPASEGVTVTVTPAEIHLAGNKITPTGKSLDFNYKATNLGGFGISNCIIFRPNGVKTDPGSAYLVEVMGLQAPNGKPAELRYFVEFFKPQQSNPEAPSR